MTQPWEQQPNETDKAFDAFKVYRDLAPNKRSLAATIAIILARDKAQNKPKKSPNKIVVSGKYKNWAKKYNWPARVRAYDAHLDQIEREAFEQERIKDAKDRLTIWRGLRSKMLLKLSTLDSDDIDTNQLLKGLELANKNIRLELGEDETDKADPVQVNIQNNLGFDMQAMIEKVYGNSDNDTD